MCSNGGDALELFRSNSPQLVLTDIKMPILSGIELLHEIKSLDPAVYVVMLTSHNDFEYARNALTFGADEYILKSEITAETLGKIIETCKARISADPLKSPTVLAGAQRAEFYSPESLSELMMDIPAVAPSGSYFVLAVPIMGDNRTGLQSTAQEVARRHGQLSVEYHACGGLLLCKAAFPNIPSMLFQMNLYHSFATNLLHSCARDIGSSGIRSGGLYRDAAMRASLALSAAFYEETSAPKLHSTEAFSLPGLGEYAGELYRKAVAAVLQLDFGRASGLISELMREIGTKKPPDIPAVKRSASDIIGGYKTAAIGSELDLLSQTCISVSERIQAATSFSELREAVGSFLADAGVDALCVQTGYSPYIQAAVAEIQKGYANIQKVSAVADKLGLNMEYFCRLFKSETGSTFVTYLTEHRLKVAETLLKNTDMKVSEIASAVGYDNLSYFSRLFKKKVGANPYSYRANSEE